MFILRTLYSQKNKPGSICLLQGIIAGNGIKKKILGYKVGGDFTTSSATSHDPAFPCTAEKILPALEDAGHPQCSYPPCAWYQAGRAAVAALGRIVGKTERWRWGREEERKRGKKIFIWE